MDADQELIVGDSCARSNIVPGTTIARGGFGILLQGPSGTGKSDLAIRALATPIILPGEDAPSPFELVSDDQTVLVRRHQRLIASPPEPLRDLIEVRSIGIVSVNSVANVPLALVVDLASRDHERLPDYPGRFAHFLGCQVDLVSIAPFEASAPVKIGLALQRSLGAAKEAETR